MSGYDDLMPDAAADSDFSHLTMDEAESAESAEHGARGGGSAAPGAPAAAAPSAIPVAPAPPADQAHDEHEARSPDEEDPSVTDPADAARTALDVPEVPISEQLTDHRDEAQGFSGTSSAGSGPAGAAGQANIAMTTLSVHSQVEPPKIVRLPRALRDELERKLDGALVQETGSSVGVSGKSFAESLSASALVVAFLTATLDVDIEVDASTQRAVELFRIGDPTLGRLVKTGDALQATLHRQARAVQSLTRQLQSAAGTVGVVEQLLGWMVADRVENLARGVSTVEDLQVMSPRIAPVLTNARTAVEKAQKAQQEREDRRIA